MILENTEKKKKERGRERSDVKSMWLHYERISSSGNEIVVGCVGLIFEVMYSIVRKELNGVRPIPATDISTLINVSICRFFRQRAPSVARASCIGNLVLLHENYAASSTTSYAVRVGRIDAMLRSKVKLGFWMILVYFD